VRRLECIEPACRVVDLSQEPLWHAGSLAVYVLRQRHAEGFKRLDRRGRKSAKPGPSTPQGSPWPQNASQSAVTTIPAAGRPDDRASPSGGPGVLCRLRSGAWRRGRASRTRGPRCLGIPASAAGATQAHLDPATRIHAHPLDTEPSCETTLPTVHQLMPARARAPAGGVNGS
jgi:hypothetical protein